MRKNYGRSVAVGYVTVTGYKSWGGAGTVCVSVCVGVWVWVWWVCMLYVCVDVCVHVCVCVCVWHLGCLHACNGSMTWYFARGQNVSCQNHVHVLRTKPLATLDSKYLGSINRSTSLLTNLIKLQTNLWLPLVRPPLDHRRYPNHSRWVGILNRVWPRQHALWEEHFPYIFTTHSHICVVLILTKETAPVERN